MEIKTIYEDEYVLALDKPSGLLVHHIKEAPASVGVSADDRKFEPVLTDWILENYPDLLEVGEPINFVQGKEQKIIKRPGIVHRLDKDTSGIILVAKTQESYQFLKEQFQNRKVEKIYNAVVWGNFSDDKLEGVINAPIGRSRSDFRRWSAEYGAKGELREAVTEYKVLAPRPHPLPSPLALPKLERRGVAKEIAKTPNYKNFSYLEVKPKTGRTHQIRVHLKSISHPVVCDKLYASKKVCDGSDACFGFSRLALHALSIKIQLPNGTFITIESPLPKEFETALNLLK